MQRGVRSPYASLVILMTMGLSVVACWTAGYAAQPDLAVWRPAEGKWYVLNSSTGTATVTPWGLPGDILVPLALDVDDVTINRQ